MKKISIIVPMYYEEEVVHECYNRLTNVMNSIFYNYELIFVNDGSRDETLPRLQCIAEKDKHTKVISLSRNFGHQVAVTAGIDYAQGDALIVIDADLQDPPELIPHMIDLWEQGYEVVYAKRQKRLGETWIKKKTAKCFYRILNRLSSVHIPVDTGDFRLIDRKVANQLRRLSEHNRFIRGLVSWTGFRQTSITYQRDERFAGETKYPLKKMLTLAADGIFSFSDKPLKFILYMGILSFTMSIFLFVFGVIASIYGWSVAMSIWLIYVIFFWGSTLLISLGIMGQYLTRIYDESRARPLYIVDKNMNIENYANTQYYNTIEKKLG